MALDTPSRLVVASLPSRVPRGFSPRFGRPLAGPSPPALASSRGPFPSSYPVWFDTVEAGFMTTDLALLVGADQKWLSTTGFLDKVDENLKKAMAA